MNESKIDRGGREDESRERESGSTQLYDGWLFRGDGRVKWRGRGECDAHVAQGCTRVWL